jgi:precorrin-6B methylase 2
MTQPELATIIHYVEIIFLVIFIPVWVSYEYFQKKTGVPVFPSMPPMRKKIIGRLKQDIAERNLENYRIIDLGSGSGQLTWHIARAFPNAKITGVELSYIPWLRSVVRKKLWGVKNLNYIRADFWSFDLSPADAVITYLPGKIMEQVGQKLHKDLRPGTLITANAFYLRDGWEPIETYDLYVPIKVKLFVYRQS